MRAKQYRWWIGIILSASMLIGCGGGDSTAGNSDADASTSHQSGNTHDDNTTHQASTYVAGSGILTETRADKTLVWVNTQEDAKCKVSRPTSRSGTVYQDGVAHCESLSHAGIDSWRLPTVQESQNLMKTAGKSLLIFPASNPNCAIMTTSTEETFVYTTSDWNVRDGNPVGGAFTDAARNNKTAGIRCVADR